ncbi:NAD(P)H-flavin reductase [Inhella gelatinilytica]|uniref:NAD(P)H-flavin reductase n=1 Tax=Inhella gelatinilytica TaxID=2795030 RepID=UPI001FE9F833|nr:NAD(P)H-flavin reductase [Inhella gelatinilytica]
MDIEDLGELAALKLMTVPARIDTLEHLSESVLRVRLRLPPQHGFRYLAGQYVNIVGPGNIKRPYSIANAPASDGKLEFHIKRIPAGAMSEYWFEKAKPGELLRFEGPRGSFFLRPVGGARLICMATGTGYAPIQALLQELATRPASEQPSSIHLIWGGRQPADFYLAPPRLGPGSPPVNFIPTLSRPHADWTGARGYVQDIVKQKIKDLGNTWVYACGSDAMITSAQCLLEQAGLPRKHFLSDAFVAA